MKARKDTILYNIFSGLLREEIVKDWDDFCKRVLNLSRSQVWRIQQQPEDSPEHERLITRATNYAEQTRGARLSPGDKGSAASAERAIKFLIFKVSEIEAKISGKPFYTILSENEKMILESR